MSWILFWACLIWIWRHWSKVWHLLCIFVQVVTHILHFSPKPAWKWWIVVFHGIKRLPKFSIAAAAHITDCTRLCKDWVKAPFIINGTIPRDCCTRSPPVLHARPAGARVVSLRGDESFQGHDKGPAFGRILFYCAWKAVQWAGQGSEDTEVAERRLVSRCNTECCDSDTDSAVLQPQCCLHASISITQCLCLQITSPRFHPTCFKVSKDKIYGQFSM